MRFNFNPIRLGPERRPAKSIDAMTEFANRQEPASEATNALDWDELASAIGLTPLERRIMLAEFRDGIQAIQLGVATLERRLTCTK